MYSKRTKLFLDLIFDYFTDVRQNLIPQIEWLSFVL